MIEGNESGVGGEKCKILKAYILCVFVYNQDIKTCFLKKPYVFFSIPHYTIVGLIFC